MNANGIRPRTKAALATAVIFLLGVTAGVAGDRIWLGLRPPTTEAAALTSEAMAEALDLTPTQRTRVSRVLDTLRVEMTRAVATGGPDSLRSVARQARQRLEDALPPDRRGAFREWMETHHARMMEHMGGGMMGRPGMDPGRMGPDSAAPGMMTPGRGMGPGTMDPGSTNSGMMGPGQMGPGMMMGRDSSGG